jgi:pimeloyl-ACP methyl ester carboxylesterase
LPAPDIVLIHGANGCAAEMEPLAAPLRPFGRVFVLDLVGHGGRPVPEHLAIGDSAADVIEQLDRAGIERAFFVGYSLGGYVALYLARHFAARTAGACAIAAKLVFDDATVSRWCHLANPERLARPGNPRGPQMLSAHGDGWRTVTTANAALFAQLGREPALGDADLAAIDRPVLLVNSNRDQLVPWSETLHLGAIIPAARLVMFYGLAHPLRNVQVNPVGYAVGQWIEEFAGTR